MANVIKSGRAPKSAILAQVDELMPEPKGAGSMVRRRKDAARIAAEIVLCTRPQSEIARAYNIRRDTLVKFRKTFVTPAVRQFVLGSMEELEAEAVAGRTEVQNLVRESLVGLIEELRDLYATAKSHLDEHKDDGDEYLVRLGPLVRLLDTQGKQIDRLTNSMSKQALQDGAVTPLAEHPQVHRLLHVLRTLFLLHPEAGKEFFRLLEEQKLVLDV